jgi:hypothetical protein
MKNLVSACVVFGLVLVSTSASAAGNSPCAADIQRFCPEVKKGEGRITRCLADHASDLSRACAAKVAKAKLKANVEPFKKACKADLAKLCADVEPGEGRREACLRKHEAKVSPACRAVLDQRKAGRARFGAACQADLDKHCASIKPGRKRALKCLRQFDDQLSAGCKKLLGL